MARSFPAAVLALIVLTAGVLAPVEAARSFGFLCGKKGLWVRATEDTTVFSADPGCDNLGGGQSWTPACRNLYTYSLEAKTSWSDSYRSVDGQLVSDCVSMSQQFTSFCNELFQFTGLGRISSISLEYKDTTPTSELSDPQGLAMGTAGFGEVTGVAFSRLNSTDPDVYEYLFDLDSSIRC
eukprot:jgi/Mesvir1/15404/Mv06589-RA.1